MKSRREVLKAFGRAAVALPLFELVRPDRAWAGGTARRAVFFYFPDGVLGRSQNGEPSEWHATGSETQFTLGPLLQPLEAWKGQCVFLNGLSMGPTDAGSHPGGAQKLLTGVDKGNGESIDHFLSRTAGAQAPFRHLYLGAMANQNNASGDKHISYSGPGQSLTPEDDPQRAFERVFGGGVMQPPPAGADARVSLLDDALEDLKALRARLPAAEQARLDLHADALREVEARIKTMPAAGSCSMPAAPGALPLYEPARFPELLKAQIDVAVAALACGRTQVATIQCSFHTSELLMSRFPNTPLYEPGYDMRSHQASHYGPAHDMSKREVRAYAQQRIWFVQQFAYLLEQLKARPQGAGTLLDDTVLLLCTEVSDGNTHGHDDMPFVLAGGAGGALRGGRLVQPGYRRHGDLLCSIAHAMGQTTQGFGDASTGPLPGLLS